MYARVTFATAEPAKVDQTIKIMRDSILPAAKKQKGFKGLIYLTNRKTGKGMSIVLWNTEDDMKAGESSGFYQEQLAKEMPFLSGPPTMEHYEVSLKG
jgi:heme-degrading monooxygenase HmoA